uniref:Secreted protein n=1 Tax=Sphaeramia orbicularis TaxID=375764 RepID=A0A672ZMX3_9TELE
MRAPHAVLCPHGVLDAVNLLLVAASVHHGALFGVPQCSLQGLNSLSSRPKTFLQLWKLRLSSASSFWMVSFRVLFFSFSFSNFLFHCSAVSSRLIEAVFLIVLALGSKEIKQRNSEKKN